MATMNLSLPDALQAFVDEQVEAGGYSTSDDYVRDLIRKDCDRQLLQGLLSAGAASRLSTAADVGYFDALRHRLGGSDREPPG